MDAYVALSSRNCHPPPSLTGEFPVNVPASRFLRPCSHALRALEPLRLRRITTEMNMAAKRGLLYHLWWHPHNFGVEMEYNLAFLRKILDHYRSLNECYGFESINMSEVADACLAARPRGGTVTAEGAVAAE